MRVQEFMTENPACCPPSATLQELAQLMAERDCGEIPIVENTSSRRLVGVVTDRDITCRAVARGSDPRQTRAQEVMSAPVVCVSPETDLEECCRTMEEKQLRRIPVVDASGVCCGIVAQADIARAASDHDAAEVLRDISRPTGRTVRITEA